MTYWDVPPGRSILRVSAGAPMHGSKARQFLGKILGISDSWDFIPRKLGD